MASSRARGSASVLSIIQAAGWPIWPLILCSVVALTLIIERFISLRQAAVAPRSLEDEVMAVAGRGFPSADTLERLSSTSELGGVLAAGFRAAAVASQASEDSLREAMQAAGRETRQRLERYLNALGTIATAAPLLGLLGTVIGMIEIFGSQAPGGGNNPQQLAHGISVALYNTAFGLMVAIPALMFHRYFKARVEAYLVRMEIAAGRLLPLLLRHSSQRGGSRN